MIVEREQRLKSALGLRSLAEPIEEIIGRVVDALFDFESTQDPRLEAALLPLRFRTNNENHY